MLRTKQCKSPLALLLVLTVVAMGLLIGAILVSYLNKYIGILVNNSNTFVCSAYLTFKLEANMVNLYNLSFFGSVLALLTTIFVQVQLIFLVNQCCKDQQQYLPQFTEAAFVRLYIWYSLALMGSMIGTGDYMCYLIEEGLKCLGSITTDWIMLCALFGGACFLLFVCWIIVLVFRIKTKEVFDEDRQNTENSVMNQDLRSHKIGKPTQREDKQFNQKTQKIGNSQLPLNKNTQKHEASELQKQQDLDKPQNISKSSEPKQEDMMALFRQIQQQKFHQTPQYDLRQSLIEQVSSSDRTDEEQIQASMIPFEQKKLQAVTFEAYLRRKQKYKNKEQKKEQLLHNLMKEIDNKKELEDQIRRQSTQNRQRLMSQALSPSNPEFDKIFQESDEDDKAKRKISQVWEQEEYYPANFVPINSQEKKGFAAYKKKLLEKHKAQFRKPGVLKHPQNLNGGRSRRAIKKFILDNKRPIRNQASRLASTNKESNSIDVECIIPNQSEFIPNASKSQINQRSGEEQKSQNSKVEFIDPPPRPMRTENMVEREPQVLVFSKQRVKIRQRKPLFSQSIVQPMSMDQVLRNLIKGVENSNRPSRLKLIREQRRRQKGKTSEQLLEYIRSSYCT